MFLIIIALLNSCIGWSSKRQCRSKVITREQSGFAKELEESVRGKYNSYREDEPVEETNFEDIRSIVRKLKNSEDGIALICLKASTSADNFNLEIFKKVIKIAIEEKKDFDTICQRSFLSKLSKEKIRVKKSDKFKVIEFLFDEEDWAIRLLGDKDDQEKMSEFFVELIPRKENNLKEEAKNFFTNLLNSTNQDLVGVAETLVSNLKKCSDSTISKIALLALSEWKNDFDLQAFNKETEKEGRKMPPRSEYVEVVERKSKIKIDGTKEVVVLSGVCSKITNKKSIGSIISDMEESRGKLEGATMIQLNDYYRNWSDDSDSELEEEDIERIKNSQSTTANSGDKIHIQKSVHRRKWLRGNKRTEKKDLNQIYKKIKSTDKDKKSKFRKIVRSSTVSNYPFGKMRNLLLQDVYYIGKEFNPKILYYHSNDADYVNLNTKPIFYQKIKTKSEIGKQLKEKVEKCEEERPICERMIEGIKAHKAKTNVNPQFYGGAYVFEIGEEGIGEIINKRIIKEEKTLVAIQAFTRFASEVSNAFDYIISKENPYGVYFSEANTLIKIDNKEIQFGEIAEMQGAIDEYFGRNGKEDPREIMVYDPINVIATSQKRAGNQLYTICTRSYPKTKIRWDAKNKKFSDFDSKDLSSIDSLKQSPLSSSQVGWPKSINRIFTRKVISAKSSIVEILGSVKKSYDPHDIAKNQSSYEGKKVNEENYKENLKKLLNHENLKKYWEKKETDKENMEKLKNMYDEESARKIINIAKECAEIKRAMLEAHLQF